jgi:hypothetical protein
MHWSVSMVSGPNSGTIYRSSVLPQFEIQREAIKFKGSLPGVSTLPAGYRQGTRHVSTTGARRRPADGPTLHVKY